jgi:hypothetical protein
MTLSLTDALTMTVVFTDSLGRFTFLALRVNGVYREVLRYVNKDMAPVAFKLLFPRATVFSFGTPLTVGQPFICVPVAGESSSDYEICMRYSDNTLWYRDEDTSKSPGAANFSFNALAQ